MKNTDELNNFNVSNPDGTEHFEESYVSAAENGGERVVELNSKSVPESQRFDEIPDYRNMPDESSSAARDVSLSGVAASTSGSVLTGVATTLASVVAAALIVVAAIFPNINVSRIFSDSFSMIFSVDIAEEVSESNNQEPQEEVFWRAELTGADGFLQEAALWEKTSILEFYDLHPDSPYTLTVFRNDDVAYSGVFYTEKEATQNEWIGIEIYGFENGELTFAFFDSNEEAKKLYTVRVADTGGKTVFVDDISSPREIAVKDVPDRVFITVSVGGEVKAFANAEAAWYEPHEPEYYVLTFVADGVTVDTIYQPIGEQYIPLPQVPEKVGYIGEWGEIPYGQGGTVYAIYTPVTYTATFVADGVTVDTRAFAEYDEVIDEPSVPEKAGYTGIWETYALRPENITINAYYEPIIYTVTFVADRQTVDEVQFTVDTATINAPAVPEKTGYTGEWEAYELSAENITVIAIYEPTVYTATFVAGGRIVAEIPFTVETGSINPPAVPELSGYTGEWESYTLGAGNITIRAVYTAYTVYDEPTVDYEEHEEHEGYEDYEEYPYHETGTTASTSGYTEPIEEPHFSDDPEENPDDYPESTVYESEVTPSEQPSEEPSDSTVDSPDDQPNTSSDYVPLPGGN